MRSAASRLLAVHQLQLGADQILRRRQHRRGGEARAPGRMTSRGGRPSTSAVVEGELELVLGDADAAGGVPLGVGIEEQRPPLGDGERGGEVDGGRGLADAALLVGDGDDMGHEWLLTCKMLVDKRLTRLLRVGCQVGDSRSAPTVTI